MFLHYQPDKYYQKENGMYRTEDNIEEVKKPIDETVDLEDDETDEVEPDEDIDDDDESEDVEEVDE